MTKVTKLKSTFLIDFIVNNSKNEEGDKSDKSDKIEIAFQKKKCQGDGGGTGTPRGVCRFAALYRYSPWSVSDHGLAQVLHIQPRQPSSSQPSMPPPTGIIFDSFLKNTEFEFVTFVTFVTLLFF